jgi:hypothetical protein
MQAMVNWSQPALLPAWYHSPAGQGKGPMQPLADPFAAGLPAGSTANCWVDDVYIINADTGIVLDGTHMCTVRHSWAAPALQGL